MVLWLPDSRLEMPGLFEPGRKPVGNAKINLDNYFGKNLEAGYLLNTGKKILDLTGRYNAIQTHTVPSQIYTRKGMVTDWSGGSTAAIIDINSGKLRSLFDGNKPFSLCFLAKTNDIIGDHAIFGVEGIDDFVIYLSDDTNMEFRSFWRNGVNTLFLQKGTKYEDNWNLYTYTFDGAANHKLFINSDNVVSNTGTVSSSGFSTGPTIGGWAGSSTQFYTDLLSLVYIFKADISDRVAELSNNRYQFLIPS